MHARDFRRIRSERAGVIGPEDHGRDDESRARRVVIEEPEQLLHAELEPDFLVELTKGRRFRTLACVHPAARQGPLPRVSAKRRSTLGEEEAAALLGIGKENQGYGGGLAPLENRGPPVEGGKVRACLVEQRVVEAHA